MSGTKDCRISGSGRLTVPAERRRRWRLVDGGEVGIIDLGDAPMILPRAGVTARAELRQALDEQYEVGLAAIGETDIADQPR